LGYFNDLKNECTISLLCLLQDIDNVANRTKLSKHKKSIKLLRRYVENHLADISALSGTNLIDWQTLVYTIYQEEKYEKCLANLQNRFHAINSFSVEAYSALDKICDALVNYAGFDDVENYPSIVVCAGDPYTTTIGVNHICLKATDIHRPWNWGILAHELGHDFTKFYFERIRAAPRRRARRIPTRSRSTRDVFDNWTTEILSDIFGTLLAGPSLLISLKMAPRIWSLMPVEETSVIEFFSTHPPDETRFQIMNSVLEQNGIYDAVDLGDILRLSDIVDLNNCDDEERETFSDRLQDIEQINPIFLEWALAQLPNMTERIRQIFSADNWNKSCEISDYLSGKARSPPKDSSPIEVLNGLVPIRSNVETLKEEREIFRRTTQLLNKKSIVA
jgi:hypothetical protein